MVLKVVRLQTLGYACLSLSVVVLLVEFLAQNNLAIPSFKATLKSADVIQNVRRVLDDDITSADEPKPEVRHIGFVKVHKAASSTVQNIFFRFGKKRNLTFVFTKHNNYFSRTSETHYPLSDVKNKDGYDIHCIHGIYNHSVYSRYLPEDTVYLAIIRDPLQVFLSALNYYTQPNLHLPYLIKINGNKPQKLIRHPEIYDKDFYSYTKNVMGRDLGFPETTNQTVLNDYLKTLDKELKLVMIVEHFDESLILMKRYLNWSLKDILYIPNNVLAKGQWSIANLTTYDIDRFQTRNKLDIAVYNVFYKKFWDQMYQEGTDFVSELLHLRATLDKVFTFCKSDVAKTSNSKTATTKLLIIHESDWNEEFALTEDDCKYMMMAELDFITELRREQGSEMEEPKSIKQHLGLYIPKKKPVISNPVKQDKPNANYNDVKLRPLLGRPMDAEAERNAVFKQHQMLEGVFSNKRQQ